MQISRQRILPYCRSLLHLSAETFRILQFKIQDSEVQLYTHPDGLRLAHGIWHMASL
jgi:hypothetical protein